MPRVDAFDLLEAAYEKGRKEGRWNSKSAFANFLDVAQGTASAWLHRRKRPGVTHIFLLRERFAIEPSLWTSARIVRVPPRAA